MLERTRIGQESLMKITLVLLTAFTALLSGCVVAPDRDEHRDGGYYSDGRYHHHDRDRGDRDDHRDYGDRDRWQNGPRY